MKSVVCRYENKGMTEKDCPEYYKGECSKFSFARCPVSDRLLGITEKDIYESGVIEEKEENEK